MLLSRSSFLLQSTSCPALPFPVLPIPVRFPTSAILISSQPSVRDQRCWGTHPVRALHGVGSLSSGVGVLPLPRAPTRPPWRLPDGTRDSPVLRHYSGAADCGVLGTPRSPHPFVVREYGSGIGALAWDVIAGLSHEAPECRAALEYRLVETNPLRLAESLAGFTESGLHDAILGEEIPPGSDPEPITGVVIANEVADALPVHRLIWRDSHLREAWWSGPAANSRRRRATSRLRQRLLILKKCCGRLASSYQGDRIDISPAAAAWFTLAARGLFRGYAIVIDYGYPATELYRAHRLAGTVRAHRGHTVTDRPFEYVGEQDLTAHVDFTALRRAGEAPGSRSPGSRTRARSWPVSNGDLLVALGKDPQTHLAEYLAAQAATLRLIDPGGMGRFGVLIMARDAPVCRPHRVQGATVAVLDRGGEVAVYLFLSGADMAAGAGARRLAGCAVRGTGRLEPRPLARYRRPQAPATRPGASSSRRPTRRSPAMHAARSPTTAATSR